MKYTKKDMGSFKLHMINTDKFKTIAIKVIFRRKIVKEEITMRNILSDILLQATKKYPSKRDLTIKAQDLYAVEFATSCSRLGNYATTTVHMNSLNDKYTEKGNFKQAVEFLSEIIFNPYVEDNKFDSLKLDVVKSNCRSNLNSLKEDASNYSVIRLLEEFDSDSVVSYRLSGYLEDLDSINASNLYDYYLSMLENDLVDVFVLGEIDEDEVTKMFKEYFSLRTIKRKEDNYLLDERSKRNVRHYNEKIDNSQSKLAIACTCNDLSVYERNYVLTLYNIILGGGSDSKFFKEVREKYSLCYTIYSAPNKLDKLLIIQAGIDKDNYDMTMKLIEKNMQEMCKGKFDESDISIAREYYLTALEEIEESSERIIDNYLMMELIGTDTIDVKREMINKVTKDEIIKLAKKIKLDTVFLLEGVKDERD